jgi:hypothetical protein
MIQNNGFQNIQEGCGQMSMVTLLMAAKVWKHVKFILHEGLALDYSQLL